MSSTLKSVTLGRLSLTSIIFTTISKVLLKLLESTATIENSYLVLPLSKSGTELREREAILLSSDTKIFTELESGPSRVKLTVSLELISPKIVGPSSSIV